jgi:hypothetical protein
MACLWLSAGFVAGGTHSLAIERSRSHAGEWFVLVGLLRLLLVGAVLTLAALVGYLPSAFGGWAVGFVVSLLVVMMRID